MSTPISHDPKRYDGRLRRLDPAWYRGHSFVHWSMTIEHRATGWLDALHHARAREFLCHALARFRLICPAYCFMPDHGHFVLLGISPVSDQQLATATFREAWGSELARGGYALQRQPFDHVLREEERERGVFATVAQYVLENPVRAGLVTDWTQYPFTGALVPGYPEFDPRMAEFWTRFWRLYAALITREMGPPPSR